MLLSGHGVMLTCTKRIVKFYRPPPLLCAAEQYNCAARHNITAPQVEYICTIGAISPPAPAGDKERIVTRFTLRVNEIAAYTATRFVLTHE